jgi:hypothetical protein
MPEPEHDERHEVDAETLIGRIIDREATPGDCEAFERQASADPVLWRALAVRHLDMAMLSDRVAEHTAAAERVDVRDRRALRPPVNLLVTLSGWAAVLVLGFWWAVVVVGDGDAGRAPAPVRSVAEPPAAVGELTADEHYRRYLRADFVLGELDPVLLETEQLPDGRVRVRFVRRIEEYVTVDSPLSDVIDAKGRLKVDPAELRGGG